MTTRRTNLDGLERENPFSVPDSYFETLDQRVKLRINENHKTNLRFMKATTVKRLAVAALVVGVLFAIGTLLTRTHTAPLSQIEKQMQSDSDLAVASTELINSIKLTTATTGNADSLNRGKRKASDITDVSEQEVIDYMLGTDVEPLLVDL